MKQNANSEKPLERFSWATLARWALVSAIATPAIILAGIYGGPVGILCAFAAPIVCGVLIARQTRRDLYASIYATVIACIGPLAGVALQSALTPRLLGGPSGFEKTEFAMGCIFAISIGFGNWFAIIATIAIHRYWTAPRKQRRSTPGHCRRCGYNLRGLPEPRCPECGTPFDPKASHASQL